VANWLGFEIVAHAFLYKQFMHFGTLSGFSERGLAFDEYCLSFYSLDNSERT
jgi:hypothetical protein